VLGVLLGATTCAAVVVAVPVPALVSVPVLVLGVLALVVPVDVVVPATAWEVVVFATVASDVRCPRITTARERMWSKWAVIAP
jgi:hypothetical protein